MKKIINTPERVVPEMCNGIALANPSLCFLPKYKVICRRERNPEKVSLISGGGSGHEPAHAGYVGTGMLDAAVCGDVFASPSQVQVYKAIQAVAGNRGVLLIIKNYSGDLMNFKNAAAMAREDGIDVSYVCVNDDIAVNDSLYTVGRRGVAGTVFVHKIAGAMAEQGAPLEAVQAIAQKAANRVRSIGFALSSCTVPAKGSPTFALPEDELEYGVGIHGEPGRERKKLSSADALAAQMCQALIDDMELQAGEEIALMINGMGATPLQELYVLNNSVRKYLQKQALPVYRSFVGNYMTSIDMQGASITFLKLDEQLKTLLDAPCFTPALTITGPSGTTEYREEATSVTNEPEEMAELADGRLVKGNTFTMANIVSMVKIMSECIIANEIPFCELDSYAGDGDFGMSVAKGFKQVRREWAEILSESGDDIGAFLQACSLVIMEHCGGASGPIWGSAFRSAGGFCAGKTTLTLSEYAEMLWQAVKGIQATGERSFGRGAVVGDKTLIDALIPCAEKVSACAAEGSSVQLAVKAGAEAAAAGAKATEQIVARMGRAGTVGERSLGYPDAGAYALGVIFEEVVSKLVFDC